MPSECDTDQSVVLEAIRLTARFPNEIQDVAFHVPPAFCHDRPTKIRWKFH